MEGWKKVSIQEVTSVLGDGLHGTPVYNEDGEYAFVNGNNLVDGKVLIKKDTKRVDESQYEKYKKPLNDRTIMVSINGTLGNVGLYNGEKVILGKSACYFNVKEEYCKEFIRYVVSSPVFKFYLENNATGTTIKNVSLKQMREYEFDIPISIELQEKIAGVLKNIDDKIEINNQINRNLSEQAQLLFDEQYGKYPVISIDSDKADIPSGWDYFRLEDLCLHVKPGTNYQPKRVEEGIPFLNVKCINGGYIDTSDAKLITEAEYERVHKTWKPEENDLLISRIGTLGLVAVIRKEDLPIAVHYNFINIKSKLLPFEFMYFLLKSKSFQRAYHLIKKNSVQEYVTIDEVADLKIPLPIDLLNVDFSQYVSMYEMILTIQRENKRLMELRDSLLPRLMSGELDVSDLDI